MSSSATTSQVHGSTADPIRAVSVISTGSVEIHPEHVFGTRKPLYWWLLTSRRWLPPRPINVYVIEHANGLLLFDTGQDRASVTDRSYFPGGLPGIVYDRTARFHIGEEDTLEAQLATLGYAAAEVDTAIVSHLHQDHTGGLPVLVCIRNQPYSATFVVFRPELFLLAFNVMANQLIGHAQDSLCAAVITL